ncbi:MAG: CDP-alcohol phosphatidyltransferase family protein [Acidobacteria bacterium]|nr:CDP-alcohol phosphatidyltransferase family protein [Acidobacteriota bacterium]
MEEILLVGGDDPAGWLPARAQPGTRWLPAEGQNELRVLQAAREHVRQPFLLFFADSVVDPAALAWLRQSSLDGHFLVRVEPPAVQNGEAASVFVASSELLGRLDTLPSDLETVEELWTRLNGQGASLTEVAQGRTWERTTARQRLAQIERELSLVHLKPTDGIYARFNKTVIAEPLIRFFVHTRATPNLITGLGLVLAVLAGVVFSLGGYLWSVLAALLYYASAIMDHVDGMVARLRFQQSDFGTWFETAVDYVSYLALIVGLTTGLYRDTGSGFYLIVGLVFLSGAIASFIVQSHQRKRISGDKPGDYIRRFHIRTEAASRNFLHRFSRHCYFVARRAFFPYFVLVMCLLNLRGPALVMCTIGAHVFWLLVLYNNRLFVRGRARAN